MDKLFLRFVLDVLKRHKSNEIRSSAYHFEKQFSDIVLDLRKESIDHPTYYEARDILVDDLINYVSDNKINADDII